MKRLIFITLLIIAGGAGGTMFTGKPEAKAGFASRTFRINLKDGYNPYNNNYFGAFDEWWSGPLGKAAGPLANRNDYPMLFDNWQGSLVINFEAILRGAGLGQLYPIEVYGTSYNRKGYSYVQNLTGAQQPYDITGFENYRNLSITNIDKVPVVGMDPANPGLGIINELDPYSPDNPDPAEVYGRVAQNGSNIDINIAIYPVPVPPHYGGLYSRPGVALPN